MTTSAYGRLACCALLLLAGACAVALSEEVEEPRPATAVEPPPDPEPAADDPAALGEAILAMDRAAEALRDTLAEISLADPAFETLSLRLGRLDRAHAARMRDIIDAHGWPSPPRVGGTAAHAALVMVLRSGDRELQEGALEAVRAAYEAGEIAGEALAMLTDRVRLARGHPQRYGTQISIDAREVTVGPLEDPERVDEWRAELGLMPLEEYLDLVRRMTVD